MQLNLSKALFYDYKTKYTKAASKTYYASTNSKRNTSWFKNCKKTHDIFKCRGVTRADFKFHKGNFYLLELIQPGMTSLSLVQKLQILKALNLKI